MRRSAVSPAARLEHGLKMPHPRAGVPVHTARSAELGGVQAGVARVCVAFQLRFKVGVGSSRPDWRPPR